jgi:hypothetical protein
MNWANANADRINSLFTSRIFTPSRLLTSGRDTVNIVLLKQLLVSLSPPEPPKVLPLEPVPADGFTVVAALRLKELRSLPNGNFDFSKLIRFCEELNTAYSNGCFLATIMLTRAIIDHVPPLFGVPDFKNLAQYPGARSFKEAMKNFDDAVRKIADLHLHGQIQKEEALPAR